MTTEITPNAIHTAGTPVSVERLAAMTTEEISNYFCEIKYFITSFEEELKNVKAELEGRTDRPAIFSTDHGFGGYKRTNGRASDAAFLRALKMRQFRVSGSLQEVLVLLHEDMAQQDAPDQRTPALQVQAGTILHMIDSAKNA